jgi:flagellar hook-associated protein 2
MSPLRISGLASGMDIDSMVTNLMKAERMPLDKLKQKQQVLEWQRDDFRSINTLLLNFRTDLTNMKLTTKYRARATTSTNEAQVTATASSAASKASYSISNVTQLATAATLQNGGKISDVANGKKVDLNKALFESNADFSDQSLAWKSGSVESKTINVTTAGKNQSINLGDSSLSLQDIDSMNIKVNGVSYKAVTGTPSDGEVQVSSNGDLLFASDIAANSTIKVDYFTNKKVEKITPPADTNNIQLAKGSINVNDTNYPFSLTVKISDTDTDTYTVDPASTGTTKNLFLNGGSSPAGTIDTLTGKITLTKTVLKDQEVNVSYTQNYSTFSISTYKPDGSQVKENFGVQGSDTLNQVISRVNSSNAGVTMFYDSFSDRMTMTRSETGNFHGIQPVGNATVSATSDKEIITSGDFINNILGFGTGTETGGQNAQFTINGLATERTSNTFNMNGVTFTLKQTFTTGKVDIAINNDSGAVFDNIKAFVDKYNELITTIQKKVSEDYYRDYPPLTDAQKEQLSDKQQEQWTEKAKSGLLRRDPILTGVLDGMRSNFYAPVQNSLVNSAYSQLASIGITTTANYLEGGKLEINEAKLKAAIEADPDSVENLFRGSGSTSSEQGIIQRLYNTVNNTMDSLKSRAGNSFSTNKQFSLGLQLDSVTSQIKSFEGRMTQVEDRYYRQFTAMEKAIQKANSQATYMMQQFGGGQ